MTRETWLWMRASVSLIAATAAAMRVAAQAPEREEMPLAAPQPNAALS
jgi:hypothetical protein